jgi:hypothetical protein
VVQRPAKPRGLFEKEVQRPKLNMTEGGTVRLTSLLPVLHKACRGQAKGVFANLIAGLTLADVVYSPGAVVQEAHLQA